MILSRPSGLPKHSLAAVFCVVLTFIISLSLKASTPTEYRVWHVDSWGEGLFNSNQVSQLVADARAGNFNTLLVQVRRRGDAFYNSQYEPKNNSIAAGFDPLADLIAKAHDTSTGRRLEIHALMTTYAVWNGSTTLQTNHPYVLHPDWLTRSSSGSTYDGANYVFDPGHPEVQKYLADVAMDIISHYDVDGFNWDYVYYPGLDWGYNPVSVARFNQLNGRTGLPATSDTEWRQFRRDQITALIRRVYFSATALKPEIKMSASTWPHSGDDSNWPLSTTYNREFQDWVGWMNEGILDINFPIEFSGMPKWEAENNFSKDHAFGRHVVPQTGAYFTPFSNLAMYARSMRTNSPAGNLAQGVSITDYSNWSPEGLTRAQFIEALTTPSAYDPVTPPIFAEPADVPSMLWKISATKGRVFGTITGQGATGFLDAAEVEISGGISLTRFNADATGFYHTMELNPGDYTLAFNFPGYSPYVTNFTVAAGQMLEINPYLQLTKYPTIVSQPQSQTVGVGGTAVFQVVWKGELPMHFQWWHKNDYTGASTNDTLVLTNVQAADAGDYHVELINSFGHTVSARAWLTVDTNMVLPQITTQPVGQTRLAGQTATLSVAATGTPTLTYQWQKDALPIAGATTSTLSLTNAQPGHSGDYRVVVSNPYGVVTSSIAPVLIQFSVTTSTSGSGSVNYSPAQSGYNSNQLVTLTAQSSANTLFGYWTGDVVSTDNPLNLVVNTNKTLQAVFLAGSPNGLVMDNYNAEFTGTWQTGTSAAGRFGTDYRFSTATNGSPTATATYRPNIRASGKYDIYLYYSQGGNRSTNSQWRISSFSGTTNIGVSQQINGGKWWKIASDIYFAKGAEGYVQLLNNTGDSGKVVMADGVWFAYASDQSLSPLIKKDSCRITNGLPNLTFAVTSNQTFRVECSTNLVNWTVVTNGIATELPVHFSRDGEMRERCFYRIASP